MTTPARRTSAALLLLPFLTLACRAGKDSTRGSAGDIDGLIVRGRLSEAVHKAAKLRERRGDDEESVRLHKKATLALMLQRGRDLTFENQDAEALEIFRRALELVPESEQARTWVAKTEEKIGHQWLVAGDELHADGALEGALEAYEKALEHDPDLIAAREGAGQILLLMNHRAGLSERYYKEGVRSLHDYFLLIARGRFQYTQKYDDENQRAADREQEVVELLSDVRFAQARQLEEEGQWAAARNDYYIVLLMDPDNQLAKEGHERTKIEAAATRKIAEADMSAMRHDFERAKELLEEGMELSQLQDERFQDALANLDDARVEAMYQVALTLEHDFQYEAAIETYEQILDERQWYQDARTRLSTLEATVSRVERTYTEALEASSPEERRRKLRQITIDWPDYLDVRELLASLPPAPEIVGPTAEPTVEPALSPGTQADEDGGPVRTLGGGQPARDSLPAEAAEEAGDDGAGEDG